ncbi:MAG TPA: DUF3658 domain-containing protein [Feifaniaceae bacterium]|nr:DUF3658 domain-containing protein [Feifaniaceae bacterium]
MVEVVFSNSEKGAMRCAQRFSGIGGASAIGVIGQPESGQDYDAALSEAKRRLEQEWKRGKPLGGRSEDVTGLSFALDIGGIASPVTGASRRELIARMLGADPWGKRTDMEESVGRYWDDCVADLNKLTARAKDGEPVRIWYSDAPYSLCGFYGTVDRLKNCACRISAVRLPGCMPIGERETRSAVSWGEISPGAFAHYLPLECEIPDPVRRWISMEWDTQKRENAPLRIALNGKLHGVGMDFYDPFIRKEIPEGAFKVGRLIGLVLGKHQLGIGDWLIAQRILNMVESGELAVIERDSGFYGTTLKKA